MKLLKELIIKEDEIVDLTEAMAGVVKQAGGFLTRNPGLAIGAAAMAMSAYSKYKKNKKYTTRLFAKTPEEKKLYKAIINDLMKTGHYKKVREKYVDGGIMWELKRTGTL